MSFKEIIEWSDVPDLGANKAPLVAIMWVDINYNPGFPKGCLRRTEGRLLCTNLNCEGVPHVVIAHTFDEDGWSDFDTFPAACCQNLDELQSALDSVGSDPDDGPF